MILTVPAFTIHSLTKAFKNSLCFMKHKFRKSARYKYSFKKTMVVPYGTKLKIE